MQTTTETTAPKIKFPCRYPIKIVGHAAPDFKMCILDVLRDCDTFFEQETLQVVDSRNGRFQSLRITIEARGEAHLSELFMALKATGRIQLVL